MVFKLSDCLPFRCCLARIAGLNSELRFPVSFDMQLYSHMSNVAAGAVVQSLTNSSITPLTIFAFTFSIPYLQDSPDLGAQFIAGSAVLVAGLATYNLPKWKPWLQEKFSK